MITARALATAILIFTLGAVPLWVQRAVGQDTNPPPQKTQEKPAAQKTDSAGQSQPAKTRPPATNDESPFDYQSSEKISEDLSVSFPVDI